MKRARMRRGSIAWTWRNSPTIGLYVSQFMLKDIPYGSLTINPRQQTVLPNVNFMTDHASSLAVQDGATPGGLPIDSVRRYNRNGRDISHDVHVEALYEAYLNAWFDESWVIPDPVVTNDLGTGLQRYKGADAGEITVGGELNKVAANAANARNMAGIHWRTGYWESAQLGEAIAISILQEQKVTYNETMSFSLTKFDGTTITI